MSNKLKYADEIPTPERFLKGDVLINDRGIFQSETPTALEQWRTDGYLGYGQDEELRFAAGSLLLEIGEQTKLMASCTIDYEKIPGLTPGGEPDISPLDNLRFILRQCSPPTARMFFDLVNAPRYTPPTLDLTKLARRFDELVEGIEKWKKSDLFLQQGL